MRNLFLAGLSLLMVLVFSGCGDDLNEETVSVDDSSVTEAISPSEPSDGEKCSFCEMMVYGKDAVSYTHLTLPTMAVV